MQQTKRFMRGDALIVMDMQRDFFSAGALPIEDAEGVLPVVNALIAAATAAAVPVLLTRYWHPLRHPDFFAEGGHWPRYCVQDSAGARFHESLAMPEEAVLVSRGTRLDRNQYSAFDQTGLAEYLRREAVERFWIAGLGEDVGMLGTALDGRRLGFDVVLPDAAARPLSPPGAEPARALMRKAGVRFLDDWAVGNVIHLNAA